MVPFGDLDLALKASLGLSAIAEFLVVSWLDARFLRL